MKRFYVAKGEITELAELHTGLVIVEGTLKVAGKLKANHIQGHGYVEAEEILCDTSTVDAIRAQILTAQKVIASNLLVRDCRAAEIVVTNFFESLHVQAKKLTMSRSQLEQCDVKDVVILPYKKRGMLGTLLASWWRSLWLPGKLPPKAKKTQPVKTAAGDDNTPQSIAQQPAYTAELLEVLVGELEKRGFVRSDPPAPQYVHFGKEDAA